MKRPLLLRKAAQDESLLDEVLDPVNVGDEVIGFTASMLRKSCLRLCSLTWG